MLQTAVTSEAVSLESRPWSSTPAVAAQLGVSARQITRLLRAGRPAGRQLPGGTWLAQAASVSEYAAGRDPGPMRAAQLQAVETRSRILTDQPPEADSG